MRREKNPIQDLKTMAFAGATMFVSAAVLTIVALVLPHRPGPDPIADLITSAVALACAGGLIAVRNHLRTWFFHVLIQIGNVLIAAGMYAGGPTESTEQYALLYLWGALYASYFFSRRAAVIHTLLGSLTYGVILLLKEPNLFWMSRWFVMMGSFLIAALIVNWLVQQIRTLARNDSLTGLYNRRIFEEELGRALWRAERDRRPVCVVLVDLDYFKRINDTLGHSTGDRLLKEASAAWSGQIRQNDVLARYGGDEFAALLPDCSLDDAETIAGRLGAAMPSQATCSIGFAMWDGRESEDALLTRVDEALYRAKRKGRNRFSTAVPAVSQSFRQSERGARSGDEPYQ
jgi:diguanylate cyclase (GGDEF)-like protein